MPALNLGQLSTSIVCFLHLEISPVLDAISVKGDCHDNLKTSLLSSLVSIHTALPVYNLYLFVCTSHHEGSH